MGIRAVRLAGRTAVRALLAMSVLVLLSAGLGPLTGAYRTVTVLSGSMAPGMPVGAVAILVPVDPAAVKVGDVITFQAPTADHPVVTHRVVEILEGGTHPVFRTRGDANRSADPWSARIESSPAWRRVAVVPYAGRVVRALRSAPLHHATFELLPVLLLASLLTTIWFRGSKVSVRPRRRRQAVAAKRPIVRMAAGLVIGGAAIGASPALATFGSHPAAAQTLTTKNDWVPPQAVPVLARPSSGYLTGVVRQGGTYYVYANITDTGIPSSGIASETTDTSTLTTGATAVALTPGSFPLNGTSYSYRSALQTANGSITEGGKAYSIASADGAGNLGTQLFAATVDNTAPFASDVQAANHGGGVTGKAEPGDTIAFTFNEQIDPESILSGWTGASTNVTVRLIDGGCVLLFVGCQNDSLRVFNSANNAALPFGTVDLLRTDYTGGGLAGTQSPVYFTGSTMLQSGSVITMTLGTATNATATTAGGTATMSWASTTSPWDAAGNTATGNVVSETGSPADSDF
jgi:signal peptidase I